MIRPATCLFLAALAGCAPTTDAALEVDAGGASRAAEVPPDLAAVARALDARQGEKLSGELTILGASAEGRRLSMSFRHDRPADAFSQAEREGYAIVAARTIREQMCAQPATARFVEVYDGVAADIVTRDAAPLAAVEITEC